MTLDTTLYAEWSTGNYVLLFDTQGGSDIGYVIYQFSATVATPTAPTKNGYTFGGWSPSLPATMPANDVTLAAQWSLNSYTLTFNSNGGTAITAATANYSASIAIPSAPTKTGYTFSGWKTAADLSGDTYETSDEYVILGNSTLHAQWAINSYTISYEPNGATRGTTPNAQTGVHDQVAITIANNTGTLVKTGYTLVGWNLSANGGEGTRYPAGYSPYNTNLSLTLYAEWATTNYTLTFNSNATDVSNPATQVRAYTANLGTLPTLSRMGYIFGGWRVNNPGFPPSALPSTMPAADLGFDAIWTAKNYENVSTATELDPGEEVTTDETVVGTTFTIPASAKLTTETFSGSGTIYNYGTLAADTMSITGSFLNDGTFTSKQAIRVSGGGIFTASANSQITVHHTPAATTSSTSSLSNTRVQAVTGRFIADGILTIVLDDEVLELPKYTFEILDTEDIDGEFDEVNLPDLPSGYFWDSNSLYSAGTLSIIGTATGLSGRPLNYPNPFKWSQGTYIGYTLNGANDTELRVYTIRGQEILKKSFRANVDQGALAGYNKIQINSGLSGEPWPAGVYPYLILQDGDVIGRGRMVVIP